MRVLLVSQEMPPETGWGGIGTYVHIVSEALARKGADVHVLSVVDGQNTSCREINGVTVHRHPLPRFRGAGRLPPETWRRVWLPSTVAGLIRRIGIRPTVVECPEWSAEGLALALRGNVPLVVRLHSGARQLFALNGQGNAWHGFDGRLSAWLEETSARRANVVVATRSVLDEVAGPMRLDERGLFSISYPVRPVEPVPPPRGAPRVTFLGRFEARKGPEIVLGAAPEVLAKVPHAKFAFVGRDATGPGMPSSAAWLRRQAEHLGVGHAVEVKEAFGGSVVRDELRRATVCAVPSRWESFGYNVAEALAVGRPVVASSIPPFRELIHDRVTGRLVPLTDSEGWAAALVDVLCGRDAAEAMGRAASAHIARVSDPGRIADETLRAYEHATARWRRRKRAGLR